MHASRMIRQAMSRGVSCLARYLAILALAAGLCVGCKAKTSSSTLDPKLKADFEASMRKFKNRKRYPTLTVDVLKQIPDAELEQALVDFVTCKLEERGD